MKVNQNRNRSDFSSSFIDFKNGGGGAGGGVGPNEVNQITSSRGRIYTNAYSCIYMYSIHVCAALHHDPDPIHDITDIARRDWGGGRGKERAGGVRPDTASYTGHHHL